MSQLPIFVCRRMEINVRAEAGPQWGVMTAAEAMQLLGQQKQLLMEELDDFDTSGDNQIDVNELQQLLRLMGIVSGHRAWAVARNLMTVLDDDHTGKVNRHEFFQELNMSNDEAQQSLSTFASFEDPRMAFEAKEQHRRSVIMARKARLGSRHGRAMDTLYGTSSSDMDARTPRLTADPMDGSVEPAEVPLPGTGVYPPPSSPRAVEAGLSL